MTDEEIQALQDELKAAREELDSLKPDVVIVATGAKPIIPTIEGLENPLTGEDVLLGKKEIGHNVLVIGGGMVGLECAEFLVEKGHEITIVEMLEDVARDMDPISKKLTLAKLNSSGVKILTDTKVSRFEGKMTFIVKTGKVEEELLGEFDSVVVSVGTSPVNDMAEALENKGFEVKVIGDAQKPRQVYDAIREGFDCAIGI